MAIKKHSSSARTRDRSCGQGTWRLRRRRWSRSPSPSKGWSSCPASGWGSRPSRCPRWTPSSWGDVRKYVRISATSASEEKLRLTREKTWEVGVTRHLRLDGLAERPPLHLGLEPHVGDLQAEAVPVHAAAGGVVGVGVEVVGGGKWAGIIDWEAAGGCGTHLPGAAQPPTGFPLTFLKLSGGGGLVAGPYLSWLPYLTLWLIKSQSSISRK